MSGLNLDFSGMFSSGAFAIDPTKFNFSAYAPKQEQEEEVVTEPVVVTKPDSIAQAIEALQGKDLSADFNVNPLASLEGQLEIAPITSNIPVSSGTTTNGSFMDVGAGGAGLSLNVNTDVGAEKSYDLLDGSLESNDDIEGINNYLKGEQFSGYMSEYSDNLSALGDYKKASGATTDLLNQVGLPKALGVDGKYGGYKNYTYNGETNQYELTADTERSALDVAAPELIKAAAIATFTAGVGNAIAGSSALSGVSAATAKAIGHGAAAGIASGVQGGSASDVLKSAALGGLGGYVKGLDVAASEAALAAEVYGASEETIKTAASLASQVEVLENVKTAVRLVDSVSSGNVLGAISNGLQLAGLDSPQSMVEDFIHDKVLSDAAGMGASDVEDWLFYNSDHVASSVINFTDQITKGEGFEDSVKSAVKDYITDGGGFSDLIPDDAGFTVETPEFVKAIGDVLTEGASQINNEVIKPVMESAEQIVDGAATAVRETGRDVREFAEPLTETVRETGREVREEVEPIVETVRETGQEVREEVEPIVEVVRETGRDIKETASELNEEYVKPAADAVGETVEEVGDTVKDYGDEFGEFANDLIKGMLGGLGIAGGSGSASPSEFLETELVKGFDLDTPFKNPLLRG